MTIITANLFSAEYTKIRELRNKISLSKHQELIRTTADKQAVESYKYKLKKKRHIHSKKTYFDFILLCLRKKCKKGKEWES